MEHRDWYNRSDHFAGEEPRTVHLGIDLWASAKTQLFSPCAATVHSFHDNDSYGNYGPTIILEHELNGVSFYSLYGHLTRNSLSDLHGGKRLETGESFAEIGSPPTNGDWPPHVHFQIMTNLLGNSGDFPGVIEASKEDEFRLICLDPNLFLRFGTTT